MSRYITSGQLNYVFPLPSLEREFVLDFAVQAAADAILSLSTDGTFGGVQYELGMDYIVFLCLLYRFIQNVNLVKRK